MDWEQLRELCNGDEDGSMFLNLFNLTILQIFLINAPLKPQGKEILKNKFSTKRNILNRKRRKLGSRLKALEENVPTSHLIAGIKKELAAIHKKIRDSLNEQMEDQEQKAVNNVKLNPRYFFSYAKRFAKCQDTIPLGH